MCVSVSPRLTIPANARLHPAAIMSGTFGFVEAKYPPSRFPKMSAPPIMEDVSVCATARRFGSLMMSARMDWSDSRYI